MNLMLLCAGEGTRLRPHTQVKPKPAIPFLGVPLAAYGLEWCREIGIDQLVVNTYHLPQQIHSLIPAIQHGARQVHFSDEQPTLLGTGGGIKKAAAFLKSAENFLLMNGDEVFFPSRPGFLQEALQQHQKENRAATLFVMDHPGVGQQFGGIWADSSQRILGVGKSALPGSQKGWHYIGAAILSRRLLDLFPEGPSNILHDGVLKALAQGESVTLQPVEGWWHETGNEQDLLEATRSALMVLQQGPLAQQIFLKKLLDRQAPGWSLQSHSGVPILLMPEAHVDSSADIVDFAVIGKNTKIHSGVRLQSAVFGDQLDIPATKSPCRGLILT